MLSIIVNTGFMPNVLFRFKKEGKVGLTSRTVYGTNEPLNLFHLPYILSLLILIKKEFHFAKINIRRAIHGSALQSLTSCSLPYQFPPQPSVSHELIISGTHSSILSLQSMMNSRPFFAGSKYPSLNESFVWYVIFTFLKNSGRSHLLLRQPSSNFH